MLLCLPGWVDQGSGEGFEVLLELCGWLQIFEVALLGASFTSEGVVFSLGHLVGSLSNDTRVSGVGCFLSKPLLLALWFSFVLYGSEGIPSIGSLALLGGWTFPLQIYWFFVLPTFFWVASLAALFLGGF